MANKRAQGVSLTFDSQLECRVFYAGMSVNDTSSCITDACPFNVLYWHFLIRHRARFETNPRMAQMYRTWDRMDEIRRKQVLKDADQLLARLDRGETI